CLSELTQNTPDRLKIYAEYPKWLGSAKFTRDGYPYYAGQSKVKIVFAESQRVQCLRIEQTGKSNNFDWSVSDLKLLTTNQTN
ncbi:MAG: hypothetical protein KDD53_05155, partial [Bdellovibrionales bacterium]|nr:hypothetical protein [Bdellovibrionales bacterium]